VSDFDEEAERKRLREKYEKDEEQRKETQQMSELLLKGATMTNSHCGECGSPIFRYEGQEFCPTCQRAAGAAGADGAGTEAAAAANGADETGETPSTPAGGASTPATGAESKPDEPEPRSSSVATESTPSTDRQPAPGPTATDRTAAETGRGNEPTADTPNSATARESLLRALTRHAQLAEETDEPRRAADHLAAAREAAEALDALGGS
jgi:uncharacterized Zn finger protein (UPF0148 family)